MSNKTLLEMLEQNKNASTALYNQKQMIIKKLKENGFGFQDFCVIGDKIQAVISYRQDHPDVSITDARKIVEEFIENFKRNRVNRNEQWDYYSYEAHGTDPVTEYVNTI